MKIGDRIYVRGYVDEIRKDTVIVRNDGGYFGTTWNEVTPSAQSERKKGHWKLQKDGNAICSECGFVQVSAWDVDGWDNFCHHCGADMREGEEE